ncbi:MAG: hypothetical protein FWD35_01665 [Oscillospiraceae bacterium]|nr:hypothetical protein [Oscillospiraceae bacterium]
MNKLNKIVFVVAVVGFLASVATGISLAATRDTVLNNSFFRSGQIESDTLVNSSKAGQVYIEGDNFSINRSEVDKIEEQFKAMGITDGRERAVQSLLRREVLYAEASRLGFCADEHEIRNVIDTNIETMEASVNFEEVVLPFLEGAGMSLAEYWESQYDIVRKELMISKYYDSLRATFFVENGYVDNAESGKLFQEITLFEEEWQICFEELIVKLIENGNIRIFSQ